MTREHLAATIASAGFVVAERHLDRLVLGHVRRRHVDYLAIAPSCDVRTSSSGGDTRVHLEHGFPGLQQLHTDPLLRAVATMVMNAHLGLHYFLSRTLHAGAPAQALHIDCDPGERPLLGFIWMLDDFTSENGCTQFVAGSHKGASAVPMPVTAPAGSLIMYDRSVLHGYTANNTRSDRRSIQGGFNPVPLRAKTSARGPDAGVFTAPKQREFPGIPSAS